MAGEIELSGTIQAGGSAVINGSATADTIYGSEAVSGTSAVRAVVSDMVAGGGHVTIGDYGVAANVNIGSGGMLELQTPYTTASGYVAFRGAGTLQIDVAAASSSSMAGFGEQAAVQALQAAVYQR